jgi:hypothetical protein
VRSRRPTWKSFGTALIAVALVGVAIAAAVDAIRPRNEKQARARPSSASEPITPELAARDRVTDNLAAALEGEGITGVLYYSDREDECRLDAVRLPSLDQVTPPKLSSCRFELPPDPEPTATLAGVTWNPSGHLAAYCRRGRVIVMNATGETLHELEGCAPAWKPNGTLTFVRNGEVVDCGDGGRCERLALSRRDLRQALRRTSIERLFRTVAFRVREVAWFTNTRLGAIIREDYEGSPGRQLPIVLDGGRAVNPAGSIPFQHLSFGSMSPKRTEVALEVEGFDNPWLLNRDGGYSAQWSPPSLNNVVALAWSPDERWRAVATRTSIYLFERYLEQPRIFRLPIAAADVTWR